MPQTGAWFHSIPLLRSTLKLRMWMTMPRWPQSPFIILSSWKTLPRMCLSFRFKLRILTRVPMKSWHTGLQVGILRIFLPSISKQVRGMLIWFFKIGSPAFKHIGLTTAYLYYFIYPLIYFMWRTASSFQRGVSEKLSILLSMVYLHFNWYQGEGI